MDSTLINKLNDIIGRQDEGTIHTLQEYMLHTESITYILIVGALVGITFFYRFLTDRDDDEK